MYPALRTGRTYVSQMELQIMGEHTNCWRRQHSPSIIVFYYVVLRERIACHIVLFQQLLFCAVSHRSHHPPTLHSHPGKTTPPRAMSDSLPEPPPCQPFLRASSKLIRESPELVVRWRAQHYMHRPEGLVVIGMGNLRAVLPYPKSYSHGKGKLSQQFANGFP